MTECRDCVYHMCMDNEWCYCIKRDKEITCFDEICIDACKSLDIRKVKENK